MLKVTWCKDLVRKATLEILKRMMKILRETPTSLMKKQMMKTQTTPTKGLEEPQL